VSFKALLLKAKEYDEEAVIKIMEMYRPLLVKNAIIDGCFDEDLYQELLKELLVRIHSYQILN
jgi:hypothetical protein